MRCGVSLVAAFIALCVCQPALAAGDTRFSPPLTIHVIDNEWGHGVIIQMPGGTIVVDGGYKPSVAEYMAKSGIEPRPIDLLIVADSYASAWKGVDQLMKRFTVRELWEPGYREGAKLPSSGYGKFVDAITKAGTAGQVTLRRPLERYHAPSGVPFTLPWMRDATITLLNSNMSATGSPLRNHDATIVFKIVVGGTSVLYCGDSRGKTGGKPATVTPMYVEGSLLAMERRQPGLLKSDVLLAPYHGSESSSTDAFIRAVDPDIVVFSGSPRFGLPAPSVVRRYDDGRRRVYFTTLHSEVDQDHVVCSNRDDEDDVIPFRCSYKTYTDEGMMWCGRDAANVPLCENDVEYVLSEKSRRDVADIEALRKRLTGADLRGADLTNARLVDLDLAGTDLRWTSLRGATIQGTKMGQVKLHGADLQDAVFEPASGSIPEFTELTQSRQLTSLRFIASPHALMELRDKFRKAGLRQQDRELTYAIQHTRLRAMPRGVERAFLWLMEKTCGFGLHLWRPLQLLGAVWLAATILYYLTIRIRKNPGLFLIVARRRRSDATKFRMHVQPVRYFRGRSSKWWRRPIHAVRAEARILFTAANYSLRNMVNLKFQWLEVGTWIKMLQSRDFDFESRGALRVISGLQSLLSLSLIALFILTYFGNPFD